ncbi:MAG: hypothetical protein ABL931_19100, partial [Usitatibacteraceae bacterium]
RYSKVFQDGSEFVLDSDNSVFRADNGEELSVREISDDRGKLIAIGFRHDNPDELGRLWKTEGVLKFESDAEAQAVVRMRTVCTARLQSAPLEIPKKPFLVKALLQDSWGGMDELFKVSDAPHLLQPDKDGLELATAIIKGQASRYLPVVYISAKSRSTYELDDEDIARLAYQLGGFAHVVVEPDRQFSFALKTVANARNAYGGTIGVYVPGQGPIARIYRSAAFSTDQLLHERIRGATMAARTRMPSTGLDWSDLQEFALRRGRIGKTDQSDFADLEQLYLEEIAALKEHIQERDATIQSLNAELAFEDENQPEIDFFDNVENAIGAEIYKGEILDRVRLAALLAISCKDREGLDQRSMELFKAITTSSQVSRGFREISSAIKNNLKDNATLCDSATRLLQQHGFDKVTHNEHTKLTPTTNMLGLGPIVVPKTPSDHRAPSNLQSTIRKELGLIKLDF